jgi:hypothetical protein
LTSNQGAACAVEDPLRRFSLLLLLSCALALPHVAAAQTAIGPGQEAADLNDYIAKHEDDRGLGADVAAAMEKLGRLEEQQQHTAVATALWKRALHWFDKHHYEKNGSAEAHLAAKATRHLLEPQVATASDLRVRTTPQPTPEAAIAERTAELDSFLTHFIGKKPNPTPDAVRQGGLFQQLEAVRSYGALSETRASAKTIGDLAERAVSHLNTLPIPAGLTAEQQTAQQQAVKLAISELEGRAFSAIEAAWLVVPDKKNPEALALRNHLTRMRPLRYPQLEEAVTDQLNVTPEQAEASKYAGFAQKTDILTLKVLYLKKAVKLEPANPHYLELLHAAEEQAAKAQTPKP